MSNRSSLKNSRSPEQLFKIGDTWVPMARGIVDKQRRIKHAIERSGNGACLQIRTDLEPVLDKVMVTRESKSQIQVKIGLIRKC